MTVLYLSDLLTLGTTTTTTCGDDGIHLSSDEVATTLTSSISTASTNSGPIVQVHAAAARDYVSSMSVEEIDAMISQIDERTIELDGINNDSPKVKTIGSMNSKKI